MAYPDASRLRLKSPVHFVGDVTARCGEYGPNGAINFGRLDRHIGHDHLAAFIPRACQILVAARQHSSPYVAHDEWVDGCYGIWDRMEWRRWGRSEDVQTIDALRRLRA